MAANAVSGTSTSTGAASGDFLVFTMSYLDRKQDGVKDNYIRHGLAAIAPSGSVRFAVEFNISKSRTPLQTAVSLDGKYAFTTVTTIDPGKEMGIYMSRIKGSNPKVTQTITVPPKKDCSYPHQDSQQNAPIAVGSESSGGNYVIYLARECHKRLGKKVTMHFSIEVLKLRYSSSTGKITILPGKPYFRNGLKDSFLPKFSSFRTLQVINGRPYGLLSGITETIQLLRLEGNDRPSLAKSDPRFTNCEPTSFSIASAKHFYGTCYVGEGIKQRRELVSVDGNKTKLGPPLGYKRLGPSDQSSFQLEWEGTTAVDQKSSNVYSFVRDKNDDRNLTLYQINSKKFQAPPKALFKLPPILISNLQLIGQGSFLIKELFVVP